MAALVRHIHGETVNRTWVRFFAPPVDEPQMPWVSVEDLARVVRMRADLRAEFPQILRREFPGLVTTVATQDGIVLIGAHDLAINLIETFQEHAHIGLDVEGDYRKAAHHALVPHALKGRADADGLVYAMTAYAKAR